MRPLRKTRLSRKLTQTELGKLTGLHQVLISNIECGRCRPNDATKAKLESTLGRIDWIETAKTITLRNPNYLEAEKLVQKIVSITAAMSTKERKSIKQLLDKYLI